MPSADGATRREQVVLAGHTGDVETATSGLDDADPSVRAVAIGALARLGSLPPDALGAALADHDATVRVRAAEEAARLGDATLVPALLAATGDADDSVVEAAAHALGELIPRSADAAQVLEALAGLCRSHPEVVLRETAVAALGSLAGAGAPGAADPDGPALGAVLAATGDVATVRRRAVLALAAFEGPEVETALQRLSADRDRQVRQAAEDLLRHPAD